jgi:uncharacterized membrane protein
METFKYIILVLHIAAGISTLIAGPIAIFYNFKDTKNHKIAGKIFFYAMLISCVTAFYGWVKRPDYGFYQFLSGLSIYVGALVLLGVRAIQFMKGATKSRIDLYLLGLCYLSATWMLAYGIWYLTKGQIDAISILLLVFGSVALKFAIEQTLRMKRFESMTKMDWYQLHIGVMMGGFTASTTAFLVNVAQVLPWYVQFSLPTLLLTPLSIYFRRKVAR